MMADAPAPCRWEDERSKQRCTVPTLEDDKDGYCLFHSRNPDKDRVSFRQGIERKLEQGDGNFAGYFFPEAIDLFRDRIFSGDADFSGASFSGNAVFSGASFSGNAVFSGASFSGNAVFSGASFGGRADFFRASFVGRADFFGANFGEEAGFLAASFRWEAGFLAASFGGETDFSMASFSGEARFARASFSGKAMFIDASFSGITDFYNVDLAKLVFRSVDLSNIAFARTVNLDQTGFNNVEWEPNPAGLLFDERKARESKEVSDYGDAEQAYNQLKRNFEQRKDYYLASQFHYGEMEMRRLAAWRRGIYSQALLLWLYWWLDGYGERLSRSVIAFSLLVVASALIYCFTGISVQYAYPGRAPVMLTLEFQFGTSDAWPTLLNALFFSFRTATLQSGDFMQPLAMAGFDLGRITQTFEMILGPILIGRAGLAIKRRLQR